MKIYKCPICGNIITIIEGNIKPITCCGVDMEELLENTVDASQEKHVPFYEVKDDLIIVKVGEVEHPMEEDHYIQFVMLTKDDNLFYIKKFNFNEKSEFKFEYIKGSKIYSYCNKHGLWSKIVK